MPFWQEHRKFLLRVGAALAVTLLGFSVVMGMYGSAAAQNGRNEDIITRIEILSKNLGDDEALELGKEQVLSRRWNEESAQVIQMVPPRFHDGGDVNAKEVRLIRDVADIGGAWKEKFEKRNMAIDDSIQTLGGLSSTSVVEDVDERIRRLVLLNQVMEAVEGSGILALGGIRHEKRDVISIPGTDRVIARLPVRLEVEGTYPEVAALVRGIQEAKKFIQVAKASLKRGGDQPVRAVLEVAALQVLSESPKGKGEEPRKPRRPPRRRR